MIKHLLATLFSLFFMSTSMAQAGGFFGVGGSLMTLDDTVDRFEPWNGFLRGGYAFNEYFEAGYEWNISLIPDDQFGIDWEVDTQLLYAQLNLPVNETTKVYLMLGNADVEFTGSFGPASASLDDSGSAIGYGVQFRTEGAAFNFDYIVYYDESSFDTVNVDTTVDALNFSFVAYFE